MKNQEYLYGNFFKEKEFSELLNDIISFWFKEAKLFLKAVFVLILPFIILRVLLVRFFGYIYIPSMFEIIESQSLIGLEYLLPFKLIEFLKYTVILTLIGNYIKLYAEKGRGNFRLNEITKAVSKTFWKILFANILIFIILFLSGIALILPAIYLTVTFSIVPVILIFEKISIGNAIKRSFFLMKGNWWKSFGVFIVLIFIFLIVSTIVNYILPRLLFSFSYMPFIWMLSASVTDIINIFLFSIVILLPAFLYTSYYFNSKSVVAKKKKIVKHEILKKPDNTVHKKTLYKDDEWSKLQDSDENRNRFLDDNEKVDF